MKKSLETLIKLNKRKLDELRRNLADLENQKTQLLSVSAKLSEELARELDQAYRQPEMSGFYGDFAKRIRKRQDGISREVADLNTRITKAMEEIQDGYGELKKYEIMRERVIVREREAADRREVKILDEIAALQHIRKSE
jgi:flagellar FliJ protein